MINRHMAFQPSTGKVYEANIVSLITVASVPSVHAIYSESCGIFYIMHEGDTVNLLLGALYYQYLVVDEDII